MPSIPIATPLGYTGVFFVIGGIFLVIAGLDILKIEKLTISVGKKTWGTGLLLAFIGILFLIPDITSVLGFSSLAVVEAETITGELVTVTPTFTVMSSTKTTTPEPAVTPTEDALVLTATPEDDFSLAKQWDIVASDTFSNESSRSNWFAFLRGQDIITETFDLTFKLDIITNGRVQYVFYENENSSLGERFSVSLEAVGTSQTGCDYGIIFRVNSAKEYYWFYINRNQYGVNRKANEQDGYYEKLIPPTDIPNNLTLETLTVLGEGSTYKLYINDTFVNQFNDALVDGDKAGIGTITCQFLDEATFLFDNFEVRSP